MIKKQQFWISILISVFLLGLAIYFRSFIFTEVIVPIAQFVWAIYRVFASVNQRIYWLFSVGFIILLAYRIIFSIKKDARDKYETDLDKPTSREKYWLEAISNAINNDEDSREFLRRQLGQLFLAASNLNGLTKTNHVEMAFLNLQPPLPANILALFKEIGDDDKKHFHSVDFNFVKRIFLSMGWRKRHMTKVAYKDIEATLQSLEEYMEINHGIESNS